MKPLKGKRLSRRAFLRGATAATGSLVGVSAVSTLTTLGCQDQSWTDKHNAIGPFKRGGKGRYVTSAPMTEGSARPGRHNSENTKIYVVFFGTAPSRDDTDLEPITNETIVKRLQEECDGIDFDVNELPPLLWVRMKPLHEPRVTVDAPMHAARVAVQRVVAY